MSRTERAPAARSPAAAAGALGIVFSAFTLLRISGNAAWLDAGATRFTGALLRGAFDAFVSALWPLGEPQAGAAFAVLLAAALALRGRRRAALLVAGSFLGLTALELGLRGSIGLFDPGTSVGHALVHEYPSGHAARVPLFAGIVAALARPALRPALIAAGAVLAVLVALDRIDSTLQTASDVIGGLLLGTFAALSFVALLSVIERASRPSERLR